MEFEQRRAGNPRYSLRAFARFLKMDHATLSQILRQRRRVTPRTVRTIGPRLRIGRDAIEQMCAVENDRAVLAALARDSFRPDCRWIATVTGISVDEVNLALHRLLHSGALTMSSREYWHAIYVGVGWLDWRAAVSRGSAVASGQARWMFDVWEVI